MKELLTADYVEFIKRNVKVGDTVIWSDSDGYMQDKKTVQKHYEEGTVLKKSRKICVTDRGHVKWSEIARYQVLIMQR